MFSIRKLQLSTEAKERLTFNENELRNLNDLVGYEFDKKYVADKEGNVYRIKDMVNGKLIVVKLNPYINRDGYVEYVLYDKYTKKKHIQGQRVVAGLYLERAPGKNEVNHKDGNRSNNKVENLEWVDHSENIKHSYDVVRKEARFTYIRRKPSREDYNIVASNVNSIFNRW